jgi:hypothetical protein
MVRENHPNKCPHICLYLTVNQQTDRLGRSFAEGDPPAEVAHYTYRRMLCKPFFQKVLSRHSWCLMGATDPGSGHRWYQRKVLPAMSSLRTSPLARPLKNNGTAMS